MWRIEGLIGLKLQGPALDKSLGPKNCLSIITPLGYYSSGDSVKHKMFLKLNVT